MYPPKVHQFSYVTDEACTEDEILSMEIIIMMVRRVASPGMWTGSLLLQQSCDWFMLEPLNGAEPEATHTLMIPSAVAGAEMEPESSDSRLLAQRLHAGGLSEGDGRAASAQIPPGHLHADCTGAHCLANCSVCLLGGVQSLTEREEPLVPLIEVTWV